MKKVLITGGAGFIGSWLVDALLAKGCEVMSFDCLLKQVHPLSPKWPEYQNPETPGLFPWFGDCRDFMAVLNAFFEFQPDTVIHLAAMVGVAQSNIKIAPYTSDNLTGTAVVLDAVITHNGFVDDRLAILQELQSPPPEVQPQEGEDETEARIRYEEWEKALKNAISKLPERKIEQVFIAGSMSAYGEGKYQYIFNNEIMSSNRGNERKIEDMTEGIFEPIEVLSQVKTYSWEMKPIGIGESEKLKPSSIYAWTKAEQERLGLMVGKLHRLDVRVGRFFNVYGSRQALSNSYTGVGAIFAARCLSGLVPQVYEDGKQLRDFIHVRDVAQAIIIIMERGEPGETYNVGTGEPHSILELATLISSKLQSESPIVTGEFRVGDIRHCFADARKLRRLGWTPTVAFNDGVDELIEWVRQQPREDRATLERAHKELDEGGMLGKPGERK